MGNLFGCPGRGTAESEYALTRSDTGAHITNNVQVSQNQPTELSLQDQSPSGSTVGLPRILLRFLPRCLRTQALGTDLEPETMPSEILARGPLPQAAYKQALKSGKIKNPRLPVVLVGQSGSGKTSLLRSLNGDKFNASVDSTVGAKIQRSLAKVDCDWEQNENNDNLLYNHCTAMGIVKHLKKSAQPNPDDEDDINSLDNNQSEYSTLDDSAQNNATAPLVEREDNNTTQNGDKQELLPDEKQMQIEKDLKKPAQLNPDNEDGITSSDNNQLNEYSTKNDSAQNNATAPLVEQEDNNTTQNVDKQELPDEVAICTANILAEKQMKNYLFFHTMDFAGQPVYSVTHPAFLPPKAIYLLVHSLKNELHSQATDMEKTGAVDRKRSDHDPMTNMGYLKFWLSLIDAISKQVGVTPVFVVSTHADKPFEKDVETTARKILATLTEEGFVPGRHVARRIYTVDNTVSGSSSPEDTGIKKLKTDIYKKAKILPQMKEDIPIRWLRFEKKLGHLVQDDKRKHISFQEAKSIALQFKVDVSSDELETLLNYLHDLKVIIHFPKTGMIIIDTQWLLDMFAKVITVQPIEDHEGYETQWKKLENEGIIDVKFLKHLWKDLLNDDTSVESLITIMEKFCLVCKQRDGSFLVPAMLSNSPIDEWHKLMKSDDCASPLVVRFKCSHLPLGLFPRLLVAVDKISNLKWESSTPPHLLRNFARFYIQLGSDYELSLVLMAETTTITVALIDDVNPCRRDDVYVQQCKSILEFLRETLKEMVTSFPWMKSLAEFDFCIGCPICLTTCKKHNRNNCYQDSCVHLVSEKECLKTAIPRCQKTPTKPNVIPDTSYTHWFPRSKSQTPVRTVHTAVHRNRGEDIFDSIINQVMENIEKFVGNATGNQFELPPTGRESQQYRQWCETLYEHGMLTGNRYVVTYADQLREYNIALSINDATRMKDAVAKLRKYFSRLNEKKFTDVDRKLKDLYLKASDAIDEGVNQHGEPLNPKSLKLQEILLEQNRGSNGAKGIIFSKTRETTLALEGWIKETDALKDIVKPLRLIGSNDSDGAMTQNDQEEVISKFKHGRECNLIIATTVAEEGLDIADCSYVIRYDMIGNEISSVQSRGRIRTKEGGQYCSVIGADSNGLQKEQLNQYREILMIEALARVQKMDENAYTSKIQEFQDEAAKERTLKERLRKCLKSKYDPNDVTFKCRKCQVVACQAHDLRQVKSSYHVVIPDDFDDKIEKIDIHPSNVQSFYDVSMPQSIQCKKCGEHWGCIVNLRGLEMPCLKVNCFVLELKKGSRVLKMNPKKWKKCPFNVPQVEISELLDLKVTILP